MMGQDMSIEEEEQFYYRHKVEVHLSLVVVDNNDGPKFAIQTEYGTSSLPKLNLKVGDSSLQTAKRVFKKVTGSDSDWFVIKQVGVVEPNDSGRDAVVVLYAVTIPESVPLLGDKFRWITYTELSGMSTLLGLTALACNYNRIN